MKRPLAALELASSKMTASLLALFISTILNSNVLITYAAGENSTTIAPFIAGYIEILPANTNYVLCPDVVSREGWAARKPLLVEEMKSPVPFVVVHHSYKPAICNTSNQCLHAMQSMQNFHMDSRSWNDIGYSFAVCGDGKVYTGRGWNAVGAHAPPYNSRSVGIVLIGDFSSEMPTMNMLSATESLIQCGVGMKKIASDYKLIGHRQARQTECPGNALYEYIKRWPHFGSDIPVKHKHI